MSAKAAVVDASVLFAVANATDPDHRRCREALAIRGVRYFVPAMVVAEATYLVSACLGPAVEAAFLEGMTQFSIEVPQPEDWSRIAEFVRTSQDFPLGGTDASVVVLAERLNTGMVLTLDRRHFAAFRPRHVTAFTILPA